MAKYRTISTASCNIVQISMKYLVIIVLMCSMACESRRDLELTNNGYNGLIVSISDQVPQEHCNRVIHGLKSVLREFSVALWESTGERASLREVTVSLPNSWRTNALTCSLMQPLVASAPTTRAHISITSPHPLFGDQPWTQQTESCGRQGDYIQMGGDLLRAASNESHRNTAKLLLAEWAKFRWGIFEEIGHDGDDLYPPFYRDPIRHDLRANQCPSLDSSYSKPFCDTKHHVQEAPTKHNAHCGGRPAWEVIMSSDDFSRGLNQPNNGSGPSMPKFKFVQESPPRFVLAVEDTAVMNMQRRWEFVRKAVRRTVVYDVPDGAHMALVVFNSVAHTVAPLSKMDSVSDVRQRIGSSLPRNPSTVPESHKCVLCGLQEALRALDSDSIGASGATIILVTTGAGAATHHQMGEMVRLVETRGVRIIPVLYPLTERPGAAPSTAANSLQPLVSASSGEGARSFTVMDEGVGNDSKVNMMVALMDALLAAIRLSGPSDAPGAPVLVHSAYYPGGIVSMSTGYFTIDDSLGPDARFSVYYYDLNHVGNAIELTTPTGNVLASVNMPEEDGDANVIFVNIPDAERGTWKYKLENRADSHQGLHIQVTAYPSAKRHLSVRLWTNNGGAPINASDPSQPVVLFAEVRDDLAPIIEGRVMAKLQRLGTNATGSGYAPKYIELFDNGVGDPDITEGDGVYSRYLPQMETFPGHYQLSVTVDHNKGLAKAPATDALSRRGRIYDIRQTPKCCGSYIQYEHLKPVLPFRREITYGVLNVVEAAPDRDMIPPNRILDLRSTVNETTREVTLTWTAPGDDYDWGRAHHYEAVLASSWTQAKAFDGERIIGLPVPITVALEQSMSPVINKYDQMIYVAIRALDVVGNRGGVSNIGTLWIPHPPTTPPPVTTPRFDATFSDPTDPLGSGLTQPVRVVGLTLEDMAVIVGSVGGFLIIVAVLATFCYCHVARRRKQQHKKDTEKLEANRSVIIKSNSSIMMDQEESRDSADSAVKDGEAIKDGRPLSPVQSWAASKLLAEHERRFSLSSGAMMDQPSTVVQYGTNIHDPFPDVTLTSGTNSYPSSQTPSTTHSDPPAYQAHYTGESYTTYPYQYQANFNHEELPPYTPGLSSQSSQASTAYTHELPQPSDISYPQEAALYPAEMPSFVSDAASYGPSHPAMYAGFSEEVNRPQPAPRAKVPPPVAPKPQCRAPAPVPTPTVPSSSGEPKRRNVTQV